MARSRATDFESKKKAILKVAAAVFAELGMDKASMTLIGERAKVSKGLLYHYYPSRDALIFDIISTHLTELDDAIARADDISLPADQRLNRLIWTVLDNYRDADDLHKVQLNAGNALTKAQRTKIKAIERRLVDRFSEIFRTVNPKLASKSRPILIPVTMSLFGILNWVYLWFREDGGISRQEYAQIVTQLMLDGVKALR